MLDTPDIAVLVAIAGVALQRAPYNVRAPAGAVAVTPVAVVADQNLLAAARTQEESGRFVQHGHPRQTEGVLDGTVRGCNTAAAPVIDTV